MSAFLCNNQYFINMKPRHIVLTTLFTSLAVFAVNDRITEIAALRETADSLHSIGRTDSAVIVGGRAVGLAQESGDLTQIVGANAAQGVFLRSLGRIDEALQCYDTALEIVTSGQFRDNPDSEAIGEIASLYINLAVLNLDMQNKDEAARNAESSGEWVAKSHDAELKSTVFGAVGSVLTGCGMYDRAMHYQELAYDNAMASGNHDAAFRAAAYTMLIADRTGDKAGADVWRRKCQELLPQIGSFMTEMVYYQAECSICLKNNDPKGAIVWFDKILALDGIDNLPFVKFDCYNNMHKAYSELGDYRNAYETLLVGNELRDSLWAEEKARDLRDMTVKYETKETELALARSEARRANTLMWLFAAVGLLLVGAIVFVVYAGRQRRRRMQKEMEFAALRDDIGRRLTRQYVEGLENERARMSRELHDGVCNDLLAIQMNISGGRPLDDTARLIDSCRESVRRISHELMPPEFAYASLDEVVKYFVSKQSESDCGRINFTYSSSADGADWREVSDSVALEVYRIIQEAVGNAVRHSGASEIYVVMSLDGSSLEVIVRDNGTFKSSARKGLGLDSIKRRAGSIGGTVAIETHAGGGTEVRLTVKNYGNP